MWLNIFKSISRLLVLSIMLHLSSCGQNNGEWIKSGSYSEGYEVGGDPTTKRGSENNGYLRSIVQIPKGEFGALKSDMVPGKFLGKRVKISAFIKTDDVEGWAGLWMRVDGPSDTTLAFDNMETRPISGTTEWKNYHVVLDVGKSARNIACGILLVDQGEVFIADLKFEVVGDETEITEVPDKWKLYRQGKHKEAAMLFRKFAVNEDLYSKGELYYYENYDNIYYYLSLCRSGEMDKGNQFIRELSSTLKEDKWINPVVHFYAGTINENDLLKATKNNDEKEEAGRKCEAYFYIGMDYFLKHKLLEAKNYFKKSLATDVKDYLEYEMAETELKRIGN